MGGMSKAAWALVLIASLLGSANASAEPAQGHSRSGPYLYFGGVAAHFTQAEEASEDALDDAGSDVEFQYENPLGYEVQLGYRFHERLGVQSRIEFLPDADVKIDGDKAFSVDTRTYTGEIIAYFTTSEVQFFGLMGVGVTRMKAKNSVGLGIGDKDTSATMRVGTGVDIYMTPHLALRTEIGVTIPSGDGEHSDHMTLGLGLLWRL